MQYEGRSPLKDVTRSVVIGAAMIPAALLLGCSREHAPQPVAPPTPQPTHTELATDSGTTAVLLAPTSPAPPPGVVRPRDRRPIGLGQIGTGQGHPTRGFAGGSHASR